MESAQKIFARHRSIHFAFSVLFFTVFFRILELTSWLGLRSWVMGPIIGVLAFVSSRSRLRARRPELFDSSIE